MTPLVPRLEQVTEWEDARRRRIDGYATVLAHLAAALDAVPVDEVSSQTAQDVRWAADHARGRLRAVFDEANPYAHPRPSAP